MAAREGVAAETEGMMRILDFFWPYETADQTTLVDEAVSAVGIHADRRKESLTRLREMEARLNANIRRELDALAEVKAAISREEAADAAAVVEAVASEIEEGIGLALIDCGQPDEAPAKRKRKLTEITSEAA